MPHTYIWEPNGLLRKFTGNIEADEIIKSNLELNEHPEFSKISYIINDFSEVTRISVSENDTKVFALTDDVISESKGKFNIAIIVSQDEHIALAEAYRNQMKNRFYHCEIFRAFDDARNWVEAEKF